MGKQQRWIQRQGQTGSFTHSSLWFVSFFFPALFLLVPLSITFFSLFFLLVTSLSSAVLPCVVLLADLCETVFHTINCKVPSLPSAWHPGTLAWRWHATRPALGKLYCGQLACKLIVVSLVL